MYLVLMTVIDRNRQVFYIQDFEICVSDNPVKKKKNTKKILISNFCRVLNLKTMVKIIFRKSKTQIGGKSHEIWMLKT